MLHTVDDTESVTGYTLRKKKRVLIGTFPRCYGGTFMFGTFSPGYVGVV